MIDQRISPGRSDSGLAAVSVEELLYCQLTDDFGVKLPSLEVRSFKLLKAEVARIMLQ